MKKLFFTLAICLFSMGAFASNTISNEDNTFIKEIETVCHTPKLFLAECTIKTTTIITIDHGGWIERIVVVTYEPCPYSEE